MIAQQLLHELQFLDTYQTQTFTKVINYAINLIINEQNKMKLNEFIQINEQEGDRITSLVLAMIKSLVQYQTNINDLTHNIKLIKLDKEKRQFLQQKITDNLEELRKIIFRKELTDVTNLKAFQWRFQLQLASKTYKNQFKPNILLNFKINTGQKIMNNLVNTDFSNLKNLQQNLLNAMKLHRSAKFKTARNSSV